MVASTEPVLKQLTHFFYTRLVKKKERKTDPWQEPHSDLVRCIEEFKMLVAIPLAAADKGVSLEASLWEEACEMFSDKWISITHWICPVRLVEYMGELDISWVGELNERRKTPPRSFLRKKEKKTKNEVSVSGIPKFACEDCVVVCNSEAQIHSHMNGVKHKECLKLCVREETYTDEGLRDLLSSLAVCYPNRCIHTNV